MRRIIKGLVCTWLVLAIIAVSGVPVTAQDDPDLQPAAIGITALYAGVVNKVTVTVVNNTNMPVADFAVRLLADGVEVQTATGNSILGNQDQSYWPAVVNFNWTPAMAGNPTLTAVVDPTGAVDESDETNNELQLAVNVVDLAPVTVKVRVEGQTATIWSGEVTFTSSSITDKQGTQHNIDHPTALGALDAASDAQAGEFTYVVDSGWGPLAFVEEVAGEANVGWDGWQYRVNWQSPSVAAVDYSIGDGDEVLWYYGSFMSQPLKVTVDKTQLTTAESFTVSVEALDGTSWAPLSGATVHINPQYTTDAEGEVKDISPGAGTYTIYAEKDTWAQYIRSNRETVTISTIAGDANGDGTLNALDITKVERLIAGLD